MSIPSLPAYVTGEIVLKNSLDLLLEELDEEARQYRSWKQAEGARKRSDLRGNLQPVFLPSPAAFPSTSASSSSASSCSSSLLSSDSSSCSSISSSPQQEPPHETIIEQKQTSVLRTNKSKRKKGVVAFHLPKGSKKDLRFVKEKSMGADNGDSWSEDESSNSSSASSSNSVSLEDLEPHLGDVEEESLGELSSPEERKKRNLNRRKSDCAAALGLYDKFFKVAVTPWNGHPEVFVFSVTATVDHVKQTIFQCMPCLADYSPDNYQLCYNDEQQQDIRLSIEFAILVKAHPELTKAWEDKETICLTLQPTQSAPVKSQSYRGTSSGSGIVSKTVEKYSQITQGPNAITKQPFSSSLTSPPLSSSSVSSSADTDCDDDVDIDEETEMYLELAPPATATITTRPRSPSLPRTGSHSTSVPELPLSARFATRSVSASPASSASSVSASSASSASTTILSSSVATENWASNRRRRPIAAVPALNFMWHKTQPSTASVHQDGSVTAREDRSSSSMTNSSGGKGGGRIRRIAKGKVIMSQGGESHHRSDDDEDQNNDHEQAGEEQHRKSFKKDPGSKTHSHSRDRESGSLIGLRSSPSPSERDSVNIRASAPNLPALWIPPSISSSSSTSSSSSSAQQTSPAQHRRSNSVEEKHRLSALLSPRRMGSEHRTASTTSPPSSPSASSSSSLSLSSITSSSPLSSGTQIVTRMRSSPLTEKRNVSITRRPSSGNLSKTYYSILPCPGYILESSIWGPTGKAEVILRDYDGHGSPRQTRLKKEQLEPYAATNLQLEGLENEACNYNDYFFAKPHRNYIGEHPTKGPLILTILTEPEEEEIRSSGSLRFNPANTPRTFRCRVLVWSKLGEEYFFVNIKRNKIRPAGFPVGNAQSLLVCKRVLKVMRTMKPWLNEVQNLRHLKGATNEAVNQDLLEMELRQVVCNYKFGILYAKEGQVREEDMFSNVEESDAFMEFLSFLGDKIVLKGWTEYRGGLNVKDNSTGTHSIYTVWKDFQVMFHVSTYLPFSATERQQLERKRHLGNDIVIIVFYEGKTPYSPDTIASEFNHVFVVIRPSFSLKGERTYSIDVVYKEGVKPFRPLLPDYPLTKSAELRDLILAKLINGERASYQAAAFASKIRRTRQLLIDELGKKYPKK
ncbi:GTPase-activating Rap/Ran-GAP domain-like protein 3 [Balamuthia mandrillaris]